MGYFMEHPAKINIPGCKRLRAALVAAIGIPISNVGRCPRCGCCGARSPQSRAGPLRSDTGALEGYRFESRSA